MNRNNTSSIYDDRMSIKHAMLTLGRARPLPDAQTWRAALDITFDWATVLISVYVVYRTGVAITPIALLVIGNRQRALGNLLHEAGHGNLSPCRHINDHLAHLLLAAPLLNSLTVYRNLHARHHAWLGDPQRDPDLLPSIAHEGDEWHHVYMRYLVGFPILRGSLAGHLIGGKLTRCQRLWILAWWVAVMFCLAEANLRFAALFVSLWLGARITVFHAITTFREMTDHYGLKPGGIFSFTREIPGHGLLSALVHPHHNGYHLTHHLFPMVPYHQLPKLHRHLMELAEFRSRASICRTYLDRSSSGILSWGASHD